MNPMSQGKEKSGQKILGLIRFAHWHRKLLICGFEIYSSEWRGNYQELIEYKYLQIYIKD